MTGRTVLISGAGIGGPALAFWLQAAGFQPTLVEHAPALRRGGYVIDFWGLGYDIAERMGLRAAIDRAGYHARELRVVDDEGKRITGFGTRVFDELTNGRFVTIGRSALSALIFEKIRDGTEIIFGTEIADLQERSDGVQVRLKNGTERLFDLVVGADGLHSRVRALAFGPQREFEKHLGYFAAAFEVEGYRPRDEDIYMMYGQPGRMLGRFTLHDNRTLFLFVFTADGQALPETLELQKALLRDKYRRGKWECALILDALEETRELYFDNVSQIRMSNWSRGRIALVGDAAFCVSLAAGQGSALAILSAYVLAGELLKADGEHERAFAAYQVLMRDYIDKKQKGAERFASAFAPRTEWGLWFRNTVIRAFAFPGLAQLAVGRDMTDKLQLPEYRWPMLK